MAFVTFQYEINKMILQNIDWIKAVGTCINLSADLLLIRASCMFVEEMNEHLIDNYLKFVCLYIRQQIIYLEYECIIITVVFHIQCVNLI